MNRELVVLVPSARKFIGSGARGEVLQGKSVNGKLYAVKSKSYGGTEKALMKEKATHFEFYGKLTPGMKKHFPKPVEVTLKSGNKLDPKIYAMEMVENAVTLKRAMDIASPSKKAKYLKALRKIIVSIWKVGFIHGGIHLENVMVNRKTGNLTVIDFGEMTKVSKKPPTTMVGDGTGRLDPKWAKWFISQWGPIYKDMGNRNKGLSAPELGMWPGQLTTLSFYPSTTMNTIKRTQTYINNPVATQQTPPKTPPKTVSPKTSSPPMTAAAIKKEIASAKKTHKEKLAECAKFIKRTTMLHLREVRSTDGWTEERRHPDAIRREKAQIKKRFADELVKCKDHETVKMQMKVDKLLNKPVATKQVKMTVAQLKSKLSNRGLPTTGLKKALQNRINANNATKAKAPSAKAPSPKSPNMLSPDPSNWHVKLGYSNAGYRGKRNRRRYPVQEKRNAILNKLKTLADLKRYVKASGIKGASKFTSEYGLRKYIGKQIAPSPNYSNLVNNSENYLKKERVKSKAADAERAKRDRAARIKYAAQNKDNIIYTKKMKNLLASKSSVMDAKKAKQAKANAAHNALAARFMSRSPNGRREMILNAKGAAQVKAFARAMGHKIWSRATTVQRMKSNVYNATYD